MPDRQPIDAERRAAVAGALAVLGGLTLLPCAAATGIGLTPPDRSGGMALTQALARRRSVRRFQALPLALASVSQLLWAAQGVTADGGRRTAPSAGALYPLELHLLAARVDALAVGPHRYLPAPHALQASDDTPAAALQQALRGPPAIATAPAVLVISAVEARSAVKYGARAARYAAFEAGAAAQNLALQATALGLGSLVVGSFDDAAVAGALRLPAGEQPLVLMPIGLPA